MLLEIGASKNNILSTTINVNGGNKGTSHGGADDGNGGSFVLKGIAEKTIDFHLRSESNFRTTASFELLNVHTFTTLELSELNLLTSLSLHGLVKMQMNLNSQIEGTTTIDLAIDEFVSGRN